MSTPSTGRRGVVAFLGAISVVALGCGSTDAGTSATTTELVSPAAPAYAAELTSQLTAAMKAEAVPGTVILVRSPAGDLVTTLGTAEIGTDTPMRVDDHVRIGSNTKTMTSTVILQLVEEGKLALTDPVSAYVDGVPNGDTITIEDLAEMRSGLYSYTSDPGFNATLDDDPKKAWTPQELIDIAFSHPVVAAPDTEFDYCNTNIVLLGMIIEELTGMSASEAFQERIFQPLGLEQTSLPAADDWKIPTPHSHGYQFLTNVETISSYAVPKAELPAALDGSLAPLDYTDASPSWAWTAGGAISTVDEMATYVEALVDGGLLDPATQQTRIDSIREMANDSGYGIGLAKFGPMYGHDGQIPGFSTFMVRDPEADITLIIATNLAATPTKGENAAVALGRVAMNVLYGREIGGGDPAQTAGTTPS